MNSRRLAFLTPEDAPNFGGCHHVYGGKGWPVVQAEPVEEVVRSMNGKDRNGDPQTDEDRHERLNRELIELLNELRVAIPGVQVLFAFLLIVPFSQGFSSATTSQEYVYFATMLCTAVSAALLIAPSSHRLLWRSPARWRWHASSWRSRHHPPKAPSSVALPPPRSPAGGPCRNSTEAR